MFHGALISELEKSVTRAAAKSVLRRCARIHDLREEGWEITTEQVHKGLFRFRLKGRRVEQVAMFSNDSAGVNV